MIEIKNLNFTYPDGTSALRDISVTFEPEQISAILGESGSGKTTLMRTISRFLTYTTGLILMDGADIQQMPEEEFRKKLGTVFQKLFLFPHLTVLENLMLAPCEMYRRKRPEVKNEAVEMLERFDMKDTIDNYPIQISGGQAQRAAIARALMLQPDYLLLDEPTSALDAKTTDEFAEWLRELRSSTQFIVVTHDVLFARKTANHGVYLSDGRVKDTGEIEKIIEHVKLGYTEAAETGKIT